MSKTYLISGEITAKPANAVSDVIYAAIDEGLDVDAATTIATNVAVDYAKREYGAEYIRKMFSMILDTL